MRFFPGKAFYFLVLGLALVGLLGLEAGCSRGERSNPGKARLRFAISFPA